MLVLAIIIGASCTNIYFENPQPEGAKDYQKYPKDIQGKWLMDGDTVLIQKEEIYVYGEHEKKLTISEIVEGDEYAIGKEYIVRLTDMYKAPYALNNDTAIFNTIDTTFYILSDTLKMFKSKGNYYLNQYTTGKGWMVLWFDYSDRGLFVRSMSRDNDADTLGHLLNEEPVEFDQLDMGDGSTYPGDLKFKKNMTKNQMEQFKDLGGFSDTLYKLPKENRLK